MTAVDNLPISPELVKFLKDLYPEGDIQDSPLYRYANSLDDAILHFNNSSMGIPTSDNEINFQEVLNMLIHVRRSVMKFNEILSDLHFDYKKEWENPKIIN